jgi:hypothetical protein
MLQSGAILSSKRRLHLGDGFSVLSGIEQYAVENDLGVIGVSGQQVLGDILAVFRFDHVEWKNGPPTHWIDELFWANPWDQPWLIRFKRALACTFGGKCSERFYIPYLSSAPPYSYEDIVLCQFDGRSAPRRFTIDEIRKILSRLSEGRRVVVLGGPDTERYLGSDFEYRLGDLRFISTQLKNCRHFIGCDSGISHVAGVLGIRSYVISTFDLPLIKAIYRGCPRLR